jgi:hypothetical protein
MHEHACVQTYAKVSIEIITLLSLTRRSFVFCRALLLLSNALIFVEKYMPKLYLDIDRKCFTFAHYH